MKLNEGKISQTDTAILLKKAAQLHNTPSGLGKVFTGLRKNKIDANDLQQAWKDEGFPDDTRDLVAILKGHGFSKGEIDKVFRNTFGVPADKARTSPAIQSIIDYAKKNNLVEPLKSFMQKEYKFKESYSHEGKAVIEDIRKIFTSIVQEKRLDRDQMIKEQDQTLLGRTKK